MTEAIPDFEDMLRFLGEHEVRYLVVGGLAFIFHAKPRYTKDIDLWVQGTPENIERANRALAEFGSPELLSPDRPEEILQIGIAPDRIDLLQNLEGVEFNEAWERRVIDSYGAVAANWIGLEDLLAVKARIDSPRHQEDARVLRDVLRLRETR